ncbi:transposase [Pelagibaculum spongiae]|uniref:Transposase n=1 Tax=Pelagibaculum spongiae TaxID=2080658 RepID=A0A2V1GU81_9GAMM|nr:transposase [Pelagibaculum spongiae]PVZ69646.1 transposase [Pelagibaculum spongiae]
MPTPRAILFDPKANPYIHACSRCVRRGWLCGEDPSIIPQLRKNYDHRRQWIVDRLALLVQAFAIDLAAYAVMSNHYHLVLYVDVAKAEAWTDDEILTQYCKVFKGEGLVQRFLDPKLKPKMTQAEIKMAYSFAEIYRQRLMSISWFMRAINEPLARKANAEDQCTGRFWEGRFKAQALLDQQALLTCMAYVDLNPLRAGIAKTPESSDYTSIQARVNIKQAKPAKNKKEKLSINPVYPKLKPLLEEKMKKAQREKCLPFNYSDYLELVDASARMARYDKKYHMDQTLPPIFNRLKLRVDATQWASTMSGRGPSLMKQFTSAIGKYADILAFKRRAREQAKTWGFT